MDNTADPRTTSVRLEDYRPPDFHIDEVALEFFLDPQATRVVSRLHCRRRGHHQRPLRLDGEALELVRVALDGRPLSGADYTLSDSALSIADTGDAFTLDIETRINPEHNTELSGLYVSRGTFCTQCEAEGFRRITYFLDRPDVLATYTTSIVADPARCPVMLSNGNLAQTRDAGDGRTRVTWHDPHPKPSYLFALVAGDLACIRDRFTTMEGRPVDLYIYAEHHNISQCDHAMVALKNAMRWDEEQYGRACDLDRYHVVAVDDFNMGAMENKGLNIFNSQYVLARPETATDADFENITGVIGHEYFHNWSGNRVTCRDWFQLSLKEGFTVFRDQQFSADMGSAGVKRIQDVNILRTHQFREDAGPMAHPVRPDAYQEINNFYTVTVYNKGAELVRMLYHLLGRDAFRRGTDLYFERHDGQAVTTDDFVRALEDAAQLDLSQFRRWYAQAGTPKVGVAESYDAAARRYTLTLSQRTPDTPGQRDKQPLHIPLRAALLDTTGEPLAAWPDGARSGVLELREPNQSFVFDQIDARPVASLLRGFSAPVELDFERPRDDWYFLMAHDRDPFVRWDAGQQSATTVLRGLVADLQAGRAARIPGHFVAAIEQLLRAEEQDHHFQAEMLALPGEGYLAERFEVIDPAAIASARDTLKRTLAERLAVHFEARYRSIAVPGAYRPQSAQIGLRALRNTCLDYLVALDRAAWRSLAMEQFETADNMTDRLAALQALAGTDSPERAQALARFYQDWQSEPLIVNKWLSVQARSSLPDTLEKVRELTGHPAFDVHNPNKVRALIGAFAQGNPRHFHRTDGAGYELIAEYVLKLDQLNPQIAARLAATFSFWRRYEATRQGLMRAQLERIRRAPDLSRDVGEIVAKALENQGPGDS